MLARRLTWALLLPLLMLFAGAGVAQQSPAPAPAKAGRTPVPSIARGAGDSCVAPVDWMRRNHMAALGHKRDATVHEGERSSKFSLAACISCHSVPGADGRPVTVSDAKHFCRGCHDYAAVKVDCFECHASRPEPGKAAAAEQDAAGGSDVAALSRYLEGHRR